MKARNLGALLALGALTALPACSMFGGDRSASNSSSQYSQSNTAPASNTIASNAAGTSGTVAPVSSGMIRKVQTTLQQNGDYKAQVNWGDNTHWYTNASLAANGSVIVASGSHTYAAQGDYGWTCAR